MNKKKINKKQDKISKNISSNKNKSKNSTSNIVTLNRTFDSHNLSKEIT